jgi:hypothetical protein
MCDSVFIGSNKPLPLIAWNEQAPSFYVCELGEQEQWVREHLPHPFVYQAGSHQGCGCGFTYGSTPVTDGSVERAEADARESLRQLRLYLERATQDNTIQMLIAAMNGDWNEIEHKAVTPAHFSGDIFGFQEVQLLTVYAE